MAHAVRRGRAGRFREDPRGSGPQALDQRGNGRRDRAVDHHDNSAGRNALVVSHDGQAGGGQFGYGATDLVGSGFGAPSGRTFKVSNDPKFEDKLIDVVGLYLDPPEKAIVLCMDEKSQIQALDRTQASLPMVAGRAGTMTHDYKRNGTTTLFAALDVLTGTVIGQCLPRHRHTEFIKFLNTIDREVPDGLQVHLILDNYSTHKHAEVDRWLKRHKRFHLHFTPTSSSWLNQVERWFRDLTDKNLRRGIFGSVPDLIASIEAYLNAHNADPSPTYGQLPPNPSSPKFSAHAPNSNK